MRLLVEALRALVGQALAVAAWQVPDKSAIARARARLGPAPLRALFAQVARPLATPADQGGVVSRAGGWWRWMAPPGRAGHARQPAAFGRPRTAAARGGRSRRCGWSGWPSAAPTPSWMRRDGRPAARGEHAGPVACWARWARGCCCWPTGACGGLELWRTGQATGAELVWRASQDVGSAAGDGVCADGSWRQRAGRRRPPQATSGLWCGCSTTAWTTRPPGPAGALPAGDHDRWTPSPAPAAELPRCTTQRWELETALDELKTHQRGPRVVLRSKTPTGSARRSGRTCWSTTPSAPSCTRPPWTPTWIPTGCVHPLACGSCAAR